MFEFNLRGDRLFRTRMAEGVRLFARLRQLFPNNSWQTSPTLVADYRLQIRPRIYPKRYITPETVIEQLEADKLLTPIRKKAVAAILNSPLRGEVQLADFQLRATSRMLRDLNSTKSRGMIVCAGTGTGKTLSFYLPALAHIAGLLKKNEYWSKGLAIYPRNELLKDQFSETYQEARRLDAVLKAEGKRKILIGAFFGLTPRSATLDRVQDKWEAESGGFTCPYLRCPRCEGALSWRRADVEAGKEKLSCLKASCGAVIQGDEVILTRDRIVYQGYDMLFNPVLEKRSLPIQNRYVIRTSAVFAFMDWVGHQLAAIKGSVWYDFASPSEYAKKRQQLEIELIEKILETETRQLELAAYLQSALNLSKDEVEAILWEAPRSLMMVVLPTLLRRLKSNWYRFSVHLNESNQDYQTNRRIFSVWRRVHCHLRILRLWTRN
ncbi:MAG: DEAD/DEAH box helicase [Nostoc sp.]